MRYALILVVASMLAACAQESAGPTVGPLGVQPLSTAAGLGMDFISAHVYVANYSGENVAVFPVAENGDPAPSELIRGSRTALSGPLGVTIDRNGLIYVSNFTNNTITVYPAGAGGNVPPIRTIRCGGLSQPSQLTVDTAGNLYVANQANNTISVFSPADSGCVTNQRSIAGPKTLLARPEDVYISGKTLLVTNLVGKRITEYPVTASGDVTPTAEIFGGNTGLVQPVGIVEDLSGDIFVGNYGGQNVLVFAPGAKGNVHPIRTIMGNATRLHNPAGVGLAPDGDILVTNAASNSVTSYAHAASGNVPPLRDLSGPATQINFPVGLKVH